jgi:hypothetical protein
MKKKFTTSYEELITNYYGGSDQNEVGVAVRVEDLFANYYGRSAALRTEQTSSPAVVLSLSYDDCETLPQQVKGTNFEEYVVQQSTVDQQFEEYVVQGEGLSQQSSVEAKTETSASEEVSAFQEYQVDVLQPLKETSVLDVKTAISAPPSEAASLPAYTQRPQRETIAAQPSPSIQDTSQAQATDDEFMADMQAILSGQKVYDPLTGKTTEKDKLTRPQSSQAQNDPNDLPTPDAKNSQAIFDRIAQSMQYANAYDLGTVELEKRFSDFDRIFEIEQKVAEEKKAKNRQTPAGDSSPSATFDSADFIQDLDAIRKQRSAMSAPLEIPATSSSTVVGDPNAYSHPWTGEHEDAFGAIKLSLAADEGGGSVMYDAKAAVAYARKFWNRPCTDLRIAPDLDHHPELTQRGFIEASSVDKFLKRPHEQAEDAVDAKGNMVPKGSWDFLDDCTHFISCCIGRPPATAYPKNDTPKAVSEWRANIAPAGGLPLPSHSLDVSMYGLAGLDRLVEFLTSPARQWATKLADDVSKDTARKLMDKMMPGDLIAYSQDGKLDHLVILLGDNGKLNGKVACHTYCRSDASDCTWDNDWDSIRPPEGDYRITLLQMPRLKNPT